MKHPTYNPSDIFEYIREFVAKYPGAFPRCREISDKFRMNSTSTAGRYLEYLAKAGKLRRYEGRYYIPDMVCFYKGQAVTVERLPSGNGHHIEAARHVLEHMEN